MDDRRHDIRIFASVAWLEGQSDPQRERYAFSYTITVENRGISSARLLTRHWVITDAHGKVREVRGEGVVGEQPLLAPGASFRYTSGAVLDTPVGTMHGSYGMLTDDGRGFEAQIPVFRLAVPNVLN